MDYGNSYRLLGVMHARSTIADDFGFVIKQQYVNELIDRALDKSANELRQQAHIMTREILEAGELGPEVKRVEEEVWKKITKSLNEVRKRDN